ncbi:MAG: hypothetical protein AB1473_12265 [Thermodesulfobacteriota bacterium]
MAAALSALRYLLRARVFFPSVLIILASIPFESKVTRACLSCAGKAGYNLELTTSFDRLLNSLIEDVSPSCDTESKGAFLFLYPFKLVKPREITPLWNIVYEKGPYSDSFLPPTTTALDSALLDGNWETARKEAQKIVDQVLDMPGIIAQGYQSKLIRAVEFLEIEPLLRRMDPEVIRSALWGSSKSSVGTSSDLPPEILDILAMRSLDREKVDEIIKTKPRHPRMGTLRFVALRNEFAQKVPDGWQFEIQQKVSEETWRELEGSVDRWLNDYPQHPLADLVLLWKTRIFYFKGDVDGAWQQLLSVYPRRLPRVLYDIRYLLAHDLRSRHPPENNTYIHRSFQTTNDPLLFSALLTTLHMGPEQWDRWWKVSEENFNQPWAVNLQERLLAEVPRLGELPSLFPKEPGNPSQLWGQLRVVALMKAGKWEDAEKQIFSLPPNEEQALLAATFHLRRGQPLLAAQVPNVPRLIRLYLVRVIFNDEELRNLKTQAKNTMLAEETIYEQGVRLTERAKWAEAARLISAVDPARSKLWEEVARLKMDNSDHALLRLARFFRDHRGELFYDRTELWHPTVRGRYWHLLWNKRRPTGRTEKQVLPWSTDRELTGIERHFLGNAEWWLALQTYVDWLTTAAPSPQMREVVKEADFCYNRLISPGFWNSAFWSQYLSGHPVVERFRKEGKRARGR